jgi:hypothetical protein
MILNFIFCVVFYFYSIKKIFFKNKITFIKN